VFLRRQLTRMLQDHVIVRVPSSCEAEDGAPAVTVDVKSPRLQGGASGPAVSPTAALCRCTLTNLLRLQHKHKGGTDRRSR